MADFRGLPMRAAEAERLRRVDRDDFGFSIIDMVSTGPAPCRFTLTDHPPGTKMRLLSWAVAQPVGVYGLRSPVFLSAEGGHGWDRPGEVPPIVASRQVALRAYDAAGMMIYDANRLVLEGGHAHIISALLDRPEVAVINAHTALAGCFLCRFERA
jgi:hypothetical protein